MESKFKPNLDSKYSYYVLSVLLIVYIFNFLDRQIIAILANDISCLLYTSPSPRDNR